MARSASLGFRLRPGGLAVRLIVPTAIVSIVLGSYGNNEQAPERNPLSRRHRKAGPGGAARGTCSLSPWLALGRTNDFVRKACDVAVCRVADADRSDCCGFCQRVYRFSYDVSGCRGDKGSREVGSVGRMRGGKAGTPQETGGGRRTRPLRFDNAMDLGLAPVMGAEYVVAGRFRLGNRACLSL